MEMLYYCIGDTSITINTYRSNNVSKPLIYSIQLQRYQNRGGAPETRFDNWMVEEIPVAMVEELATRPKTKSAAA